MAQHNKSKSRNTPAFIHDISAAPQVELLSAVVFGSLFRGPNATPAIDQGLWDDVFDEAFDPPHAKATAKTGAAKLHVVRSQHGVKLGKRTRAARKAFYAEKEELSIEEAVEMVKANAKAKFDETIEIAINLGVDPRHADQMVRGVVGLPNGTGKRVRVAVFARGAKAEEARAAGADIVGAEDLMEIVQGGKIDFDRCIATPDMMPVVGRLGKVLGPRNLMPNPKVGTVTMDVKAAVDAAKGCEVQFKVEEAGVVHAGVGKASFDEAKLVENIRAFVSAVAKAKPTGAKGVFMKKVSLSSTMGPGVLVDVHQTVKSVRPHFAWTLPERRKGN